jgi:hypothetical protein
MRRRWQLSPELKGYLRWDSCVRSVLLARVVNIAHRLVGYCSSAAPADVPIVSLTPQPTPRRFGIAAEKVQIRMTATPKVIRWRIGSYPGGQTFL